MKRPAEDEDDDEYEDESVGYVCLFERPLLATSVITQVFD
jgi:hypothetical protein